MTKDDYKVLIAEDEKPMAQALALKLKHEGMQVQTVINGEEVLVALAKDNFDILLLDLIMPKLNGFEVMEKLKVLGNPIKIIVLSNLSQEDDARRARSMGALDFFVKSNISLVEIVKRIKEVLK